MPKILKHQRGGNKKLKIKQKVKKSLNRKNTKNPAPAPKAKILDLQKSADVKQLLRTIKRTYQKNASTCSSGIRYTHEYKKGDKIQKQVFDLYMCSKKEDAKKFLEIKITDNTPTGICLTMRFFQNKKHTKYSGVLGFKKSKIELLSRGVCGYNKKSKTVSLSGSYVFNVANALNKVLDVDVAVLDDDSRLEICDSNVSIKILNLLKYGKTWYEREGGYVLNDKEIYKRAKSVGEMSVKKLYDTLSEIDNDFMKSDLFDFKKLSKVSIQKVEKLLEKISENKNSKIKTIFNKAFDRNSKLTECDQKFLWDHILQLNPRKYITKTKDEKYQFMKDYYNFADEAYHFTPATKQKKK